MRHKMAYRKLGRTSSHRLAMFRNQVASMLQKERIVTTLIKAKELRPILEKMVTLGKEDSVHNRRIAAQSITDNTLVQRLFTEVSPRFATRPGGYTRIIKLGPRRGDGAEMAILEFVDYTLSDNASKPQAKSEKKAKTKTADDETEGEEKAPKKAAAPKKAKKDKPAGTKRSKSAPAQGRKKGPTKRGA